MTALCSHGALSWIGRCSYLCKYGVTSNWRAAVTSYTDTHHFWAPGRLLGRGCSYWRSDARYCPLPREDHLLDVDVPEGHYLYGKTLRELETNLIPQPSEAAVTSRYTYEQAIAEMHKALDSYERVPVETYLEMAERWANIASAIKLGEL